MDREPPTARRRGKRSPTAESLSSKTPTHGFMCALYQQLFDFKCSWLNSMVDVVTARTQGRIFDTAMLPRMNFEQESAGPACPELRWRARRWSRRILRGECVLMHSLAAHMSQETHLSGRFTWRTALAGSNLKQQRTRMREPYSVQSFHRFPPIRTR